MGLGNGGPDAGSSLAVSLAEQLVRLCGKFLSVAEMLWSGHWCSISRAVGYRSDTRQAHWRTPAPIPRCAEPLGVRHHGSRRGTALHQLHRLQRRVLVRSSGFRAIPTAERRDQAARTRIERRRGSRATRPYGQTRSGSAWCMTRPAEWWQLSGLGAAAALLDPLRDQSLVSTSHPAQLGHSLPSRLVLRALALG